MTRRGTTRAPTTAQGARRALLAARSLLTAAALSLVAAEWGCCSRPGAPCARQQQSAPPLPEPARPPLQVRGGEHLEGLHPSIARRARLLYERAEDEGIQLRFISGYRPYKPRERRASAARSPKRSPKRSPSLASWHNFGLAFDVNLQGRAGMSDALKHLSDDAPRWERVGALAADLGLTWGKPWGKEELFHFEWHPGHPDAIRAPTLNALKREAEGGDLRGGYKGVWGNIKDRAPTRAEEQSR